MNNIQTMSVIHVKYLSSPKVLVEILHRYFILICYNNSFLFCTQACQLYMHVKVALNTQNQCRFGTTRRIMTSPSDILTKYTNKAWALTHMTGIRLQNIENNPNGTLDRGQSKIRKETS